ARNSYVSSLGSFGLSSSHAAAPKATATASVVIFSTSFILISFAPVEFDAWRGRGAPAAQGRHEGAPATSRWPLLTALIATPNWCQHSAASRPHSHFCKPPSAFLLSVSAFPPT